MERKKIFLLGAAVVIAAFSLAVGLKGFLLQPPLAGRLAEPKAALMALELILCFGLAFLCLRRLEAAPSRMILTAAVLLFLWIHRAFAPVLLSGIYLCYLICLGGFFRRLAVGKQSGIDGLCGLLINFVLGSAVWITAVCLLSAAGAGGISNLRALAAVTAVPLFIGSALNLRRKPAPFPRSFTNREAVFLALALTMVLLQAGRMNITMDYDSLHYGLRSAYILDNKTGIYENLGNVNLVYTYSKGLETLALPLSGTSTYGFVLAFTVWTAVGVLAAVYLIAGRCCSKSSALAASAIVSCIPGVMNMAVTAKTDMMTLLFQLIMIWFLMESGREGGRAPAGVIMSGVCCLMSFVFKPTALVFSTAAYGFGLLYLLINRRIKVKKAGRWWLCTVPALAAFTGIWARTWLLTGVPVTSVFTSIFIKLGFQVRWPFAFGSIPDSSEGLGIAGRLAFLAKRLFSMAFLPVGEDMDHVSIAWGSPLIFFFTAVLVWSLGIKLVRIKTRGRRESFGKVKDGARSCLWAMWIPLAAVSAGSLILLWQVDGNYFMLFYTLTVLLAVILLDGMDGGAFRRGLWGCSAALTAFACVLTCATNWSGIVGLTPVKLVHRGYYDHLGESRDRMTARGNGAIWNILAADPGARAVAFGEHPECLSFPCNVQSYYDITGSGGNVALVKTLDNFKEFLRYAKTEYIYVQSDYLKPGARAYDVVRYLIEDGTMKEIVSENGNMLARVGLGPNDAAGEAGR